MEFIAEEDTNLNRDSSTLILPGLSIGNVGQLAVDLLISSTRGERIGYLDDPNIVPCVGNDAYVASSYGELALPLKGTMIEFAKNLADFAVSNGKKHTVVLSSLDFGRWRTIDMSSGLQIYYLSSANTDGTDGECEKLGFKRLEEYNPAQKGWSYLTDLAEGKAELDDDLPFEDDELGDEDYFPSLPFAALFSCFKAKGLKVTCLLYYCSEGDNIQEAFQLAEGACNLLGLNPDNFDGNGGKWIIPHSWQSVYGPPPDMSLF